MKTGRDQRPGNLDDKGFTLVELLVVTVVVPLIVGALSLGLVSMFTLQTGVSNRLADTGDAQVVAANFQNDVQSAAQVTTAPGNGNAQCGTGTQLIGLKWIPTSNNGFLAVVSYVEVANGSTYSLVRQYCAAGYSSTPTTSTIVSYDVPPPCTSGSPPTTITVGCQSPPAIQPSGLTPDPSTDWTSTQGVTNITFKITQPKSNYPYTLVAVPAASSTVIATGQPIAPAATAGCGFASPGTGTYASTLCLVDFSSLTGNNLSVATQGCLEMAVPLPGGSTLYFCIGISGVAVAPSSLPTWQPGAFLGNSCVGSQSCTTGTPFYTGIPGEPALYQTGAGTTTITISAITVVNALGQTATGWEAVGADAESTDTNESISWTSDKPLNILNNGESYDTQSDPVGTACNSGAWLTTSNGGNTVTCMGYSTDNVKTGTAMVWALTPTTMTTTLVGGGLEAMAFGLLLS